MDSSTSIASPRQVVCRTWRMTFKTVRMTLVHPIFEIAHMGQGVGKPEFLATDNDVSETNIRMEKHKVYTSLRCASTQRVAHTLQHLSNIKVRLGDRGACCG